MEDEEYVDVAGYVSLGASGLGLLSCLSSCIPCVGMFTGLLMIPAVGVGIVAGIAGIILANQAEGDKTMSVAGLVSSSVILALYLAMIFFAVFAQVGLAVMGG